MSDQPMDMVNVPVAFLNLTAMVLKTLANALENRPGDTQREQEVIKNLRDLAEELRMLTD